MGLFTDLFGGGEQVVKEESRVEPWKPAEDILEKVLRHTERNMMSRAFQPFGGPMQAAMTPYEAQAMQAFGAMPGQFGQMADLYGSAAIQGLGEQLGATDIANVPAYQNLAGAIQRQVNRNFSENLLPQIAANQVAGGGFGTRGEVAQGIAARGTSEALANALAGMGAQAYGQGLQAQGRALGMMPGIASGYMGIMGAGPQALMQAGALERAEAQRGIDYDMYRHEFAQSEPWRRMEATLGLTLPMATAFGEGSGRTQGVTHPSIMQAIGGTLGLAGIGRGLAGGQVTSPGLAGMGGGLPMGNYGYQGVPIYTGTPSYYGMGPMTFGV